MSVCKEQECYCKGWMLHLFYILGRVLSYRLFGSGGTVGDVMDGRFVFIYIIYDPNPPFPTPTD